MLSTSLHITARLCLAAVLLCLCMILAAPAKAQSTFQYTNTTDSPAGDINDGRACSTAAAFQRNFTVSDSFIVNDVNIGVLFSHGERDDTALFLRSPAGTIVRLKTTSGGTADNHNVLYDDEAASSINGHTINDIAAAGTSVPPYQRNFIPDQSLDAAYVGQTSQGTWTLFICDLSANAVNGTFFQADLFLESPPPFADLSLAKTVSNANPVSGTQVDYSLTVTNNSASTSSATNVQVRDILPPGVSFVIANGQGNYNATTGIWTINTIPIGGTRTITITVNVTAGASATVTNDAEIIASSVIDLDSTPGNGSTDEDDDAFAQFTVQGARTAGIAPTLVCPAANLLFDWDDPVQNRTWAAGSVNNSYTLTGLGAVDFSITNDGTFLNNAAFGGQSPLLQTILNGGAPTELQLLQLTDMNNLTDEAVTTISLGNAVEGAQFVITDVDHNPGQFADRVQVTGSFNGTAVTPTLTNGIANFVIGNSAFGDGGADSDLDTGNVTVTFTGPVDTIVIRYGNHNFNIPANPGQQGISIQDIELCAPVPSISVTKISQVIDDNMGSDNPKAIPGATMRYCILVSNNGSATAENVTATDILPETISYDPGTLQIGSDCNSGLNSEDDDNSGSDESDPFGAAFDAAASPAGTVTATAANLGPSANMALVFTATVN